MAVTDSPKLPDVQAARSRIALHIRQTPTVPAIAIKTPLTGCNHLWLKLECLQVTGSFKARGAVNKLLSLPPDTLQRGVITASGGNHGLAVAYAAWIAQVPATIYLPHNTPETKAEKLRQWGATVVREGAVWDDANQAAQAHRDRDGLAYLHPFADSQVIAGQGTIALEILETLPEVDTLVVSIGGGGLIGGMSLAVKALRPDLKIIGVEAIRAPTLYHSLHAGQIIELGSVTTRANTLAPRKTEPINFDIIQTCVDDVVLVSDEQMQLAAQWLWFELGIAAELSGAAAIAALQSRAYCPHTQERVCTLICGAGTDGIA
ncbi:MAG: threonine/serine dehydratase [Leptolyngbyaceae cyanobacterium]